jgi:hypothetical protein
MVGVRRVISRLVGGIQCGLGGFASVFAYLVYTSPIIREALSIPLEEVYLYMLLFLVFGAFSILSGLLLVYEKNSGS